MSYQGNVASAFIMANGQALYWPYIKLKILEKAYLDPTTTVDHKVDDPNLFNIIKGSIKLECMITTVMYAETLASNLIARKNSKLFHEELFKYDVEKIIDFYNNVQKFDVSYLGRLLQYPPIEDLEEDIKNKCIKSCLSFKDKLLKISDYYLKQRELYNSYKHGLRVMINESPSDDGESSIIISYFPDSKNLSKMVLFTERDIKEELKLCSYIVHILIAINETHEEKTLSEKREFGITVFEDIN